jgi:hypothetical protein
MKRLTQTELEQLHPDIVWLYRKAIDGANSGSAKMRVDRIMRRQFLKEHKQENVVKHTEPEE